MTGGISQQALGSRVYVRTDPGVPLSVSGVTVETTDMTYEGGLLTSYVEGGVTWTVARDGDGNITSITPAA